MKMIKLDISEMCLNKGLIPTKDDINELTSLVNGRLEELGYHEIIDESIDEHFYEDDPVQLSLFGNFKDKKGA